MDIEWNDGSGEKLTLSASQGSGDMVITASSPMNLTGASRSVILEIKANNNTKAELEIRQRKGIITYDVRLLGNNLNLLGNDGAGATRATSPKYLLGRKDFASIVDVPDKDYLCFTAQEAESRVALHNYPTNAPNAPIIYYSTDNGDTFDVWDYSEIVLANEGDRVYMYGENASFSTSSTAYSTFVFSGKIAASGNLNMLLNKDNPPSSLGTYCFYRLFQGATQLTTAPTLPATTMGTYCYANMFYGCTSLKETPVLPSKSLAQYCYSYMFYGCSSLKQAPGLPATTMQRYCYQYMFMNCTSLQVAPALPSRVLAYYCYQYMFRGCTALTSSPDLVASSAVNYCYRGMFYGCTNIDKVTTYHTNSATGALTGWLTSVAASGRLFCKSSLSLTTNSANGLPSGWSRVNL